MKKVALFSFIFAVFTLSLSTLTLANTTDHDFFESILQKIENEEPLTAEESLKLLEMSPEANESTRKITGSFIPKSQLIKKGRLVPFYKIGEVAAPVVGDDRLSYRETKTLRARLKLLRYRSIFPAYQ